MINNRLSYIMTVKSQLFKENPDYKILFNMLDKVCSLDEKDFLFTEINYKQLTHGSNKIAEFYEYLRPFYFKSKVHYVDKGVTFTGFLTVLRQLSKLYSIKHTSNIVYGQGKYTRTIRIHINRNNWMNSSTSSDSVDTVDNSSNKIDN